MNKKILVVDDSVIVRKISRYILQQKNYDITTVGEGGEAWTLLQQTAFDVVFIDVAMPVMDGLQLLAKIKVDEKSKWIPCVMFISQGDNPKMEQCMELGANSFIMKPFQPAQLLEEVEKFAHIIQS